MVKMLLACSLVLLVTSVCSHRASAAVSAQAPSTGTPAVPPVAPPTRVSAVPVPSQERVGQKELTGLAGSVARGPRFPVGGTPAAGSRAPVTGARIIVSSPNDGPEIKSVLTDADGLYEVALPPGTYRVTLDAAVPYLFTKDVPATVTVTDGKTTKLNVLLDTGIR